MVHTDHPPLYPYLPLFTLIYPFLPLFYPYLPLFTLIYPYLPFFTPIYTYSRAAEAEEKCALLKRDWDFFQEAKQREVQDVQILTLNPQIDATTGCNCLHRVLC